MKKIKEYGSYLDVIGLEITEAEERKFNEILEKKELIEQAEKKFCSLVRKNREKVYQILKIEDDIELANKVKEISLLYETDPYSLLEHFADSRQISFFKKVKHPKDSVLQ